MTVEPSGLITPERFRDLMIVMFTFLIPALIMGRILARAADRLIARMRAGVIYKATALVWMTLYLVLILAGLAAAFTAMIFVAASLLV